MSFGSQVESSVWNLSKPKSFSTSSANSRQPTISVFDLVGSAEDVRVVLGKAADAQQAVHHARALVAIDRAEFAQPHGQIAIRLQRIFIDQDVARAIHGLEAILGVVELHDVEKVLRVVALVARGEEQLAARHVRRADERVAAAADTLRASSLPSPCG